MQTNAETQIRAQLTDCYCSEMLKTAEGKKQTSYEEGRQSAYYSALAWLTDKSIPTLRSEIIEAAERLKSA